jgi:hypothetical protein
MEIWILCFWCCDCGSIVEISRQIEYHEAVWCSDICILGACRAGAEESHMEEDKAVLSTAFDLRYK